MRTGPSQTQPSATVGLLTSAGWNSFTDPVQPSNEKSETVYEANQFNLNIDLGSSPLLPYQYPGILTIQGDSSGRDLRAAL